MSDPAPAAVAAALSDEARRLLLTAPPRLDEGPARHVTHTHRVICECHAAGLVTDVIRLRRAARTAAVLTELGAAVRALLLWEGDPGGSYRIVCGLTPAIRPTLLAAIDYAVRYCRTATIEHQPVPGAPFRQIGGVDGCGRYTPRGGGEGPA